MAFANLFGMGGAPLCSIERGRGNAEEAEKIMGNSFMLMLLFGVILTALGLIFKKPLLYMFGASDATYPFAAQFAEIYLLGTVFVMDMGVRGAALATVIAQFLSALWTVKFLTGKKAILKLKLSCFHLEKYRVKSIIGLGMSGFTTAVWGLIHGYPEFFIRIFNQDSDLITAGVPAMRIYYFGFFFMSLQFAGQAVFFSIFRKVIIVAPLIIVLPLILGNGTSGVFMAEPVSNLIGGGACFITMLLTVWPELSVKMKRKNAS